jgi:hypothetical protein
MWSPSESTESGELALAAAGGDGSEEENETCT